MVESITPEKKETRAAKATKPQTINVGNFNTKPVARYSPRTGMKKPRLKSINMAARMLKKPKGL